MIDQIIQVSEGLELCLRNFDTKTLCLGLYADCPEIPKFPTTEPTIRMFLLFSSFPRVPVVPFDVCQ